jgi:CRP-like cAMP-binding protein
VPPNDIRPHNERTGVERLLELVTIFNDFTAEERAAIAAKLVPRLYDEGETLLEPGVVSQSLFILGRGVLSFTREVAEGEIELLRIGPGEHFGEIGLLTGAASTARISALTATTVYELAKGQLTPILEARPQVAHALSRALARRLAAGGSIPPAEVDESVPQPKLTEWFMERLRRLHDVVSAK